MAIVFFSNEKPRTRPQGKGSVASLGNKGFNLLAMSKMGLSVPCGFILQSKSDVAMLPKAVAKLEKITGKNFNNKTLFVSVRSSPKVSMPGMMDTILNVGNSVKLKKSINEVFNSWNSKRAKKLRQINGINEKIGTAVIIQEMVFGNLEKNSCSGVFYSRNPLTGAKKIYGEYLEGVQGEAIVGGIYNGEPINKMQKHFSKNYRQLKLCGKKLESHFQCVQEIEFTIENGKLWLLQTRNAKLEARAKIKIAIDMVREKIITKKQAVQQCKSLLNMPSETRVRLKKGAKIFAKGLSASMGAVCGCVYFNSTKAVKAKRAGQNIILLRPQTSPNDIAGIDAAVGVLTARGGKTSHAAVIARGLGKPCIVGAMAIKIDEKKNFCVCQNIIIKQGDILTLDANSGIVYVGEQEIISKKPNKTLLQLQRWQKNYSG